MSRFLSPWGLVGVGLALIGALVAGFDSGAVRGVGVFVVLAGGLLLGREIE